MYSLNCNYFVKEFPTLQALLEHVVESGMDPNYEITLYGRRTGEMMSDLIADCY